MEALHLHASTGSSRGDRGVGHLLISSEALLAEEGLADGARAAYRQAIDSGHANAAPMTARNLGLLMEEQGCERRQGCRVEAADLVQLAWS
jgi:hypothetical protein